eukprot:TRINITY_DN10533_c0_g1_i2.p1 TRINITY_DN10533_c0_g1~~TRINITY_DN10533_c0_g1_i2.p1  ORF type:complete len:309 (+),score=56.90 TRINITY_DN10533_c0_g1_i2:96-1022(+)
MGSSKHGMEKILRGIMNYRLAHQRNMVEQFKSVRDNPVPSAVFFTCVDSRMLPTRFTQTQVGDMFIVRNAGNMVPHSSKVSLTAVATEPAVLELACVLNTVKHVVVCGHSDCKAINLLYSLYSDPDTRSSDVAKGPLSSWITRHGASTMHEFEKIERALFRRPILLHAEDPNNKFPAFIDVDEKYNINDKISMANTLIQMQNVTSYPFMHKCLRDGQTHIHALWFDVYTGEVHCFSRKEKTFIPVNDNTVEELVNELEESAARFKVNSNKTSGSGTKKGPEDDLQVTAKRMMHTAKESKHVCDENCRH